MSAFPSKLLLFAKTLAGHYSNHQQSQDNPKDFAHINIFFRPLPWQLLEGPGFYSEQSYDYDPWRPYRQGIHRLKEHKGIFIVDNYGFECPERLAGAGHHPELLKGLKPETLSQRSGCAMHFVEFSQGHYKGEVEPGEQCFVPRDGKITYLVSEVEVNNTSWISRDRGFDPASHQQSWGSEHGHLRFTRMAHLGKHLDEDWLKSKREAA